MKSENITTQTDSIVESVTRLLNSVINILWLIVLFTLLIIVGLTFGYVFLPFLNSQNSGKMEAIRNIEKILIIMWEKLSPMGLKIIAVIAPIIIFLLAIVGLLILARSRSDPFNLSKITSDLPSVIALLIIITICLLPLSGIAIPDILNNVALVVVGFYFGKHKYTEPLKEKS